MSATRHLQAMLGLAVLVMLLVAACAGSQDGTATGVPTASVEASRSAGPATTPRFADEAPSDWAGGEVRLEELPPEALETLGLIAQDGPYPYDQDGATFQNREGILPDRPTGAYREYTVETPGSSDRGARRLVVGDEVAVYYTDDHYDSFRFVAP